MYPVGSNGASQAILDAVAIARHLKSNGVAGLGAYDQERPLRLPTLSALIAREDPMG